MATFLISTFSIVKWRPTTAAATGGARWSCRAAGCLWLALAAWANARAEVSFVREIAPILASRCTGCHGDKKTEGDYRLHTFDFLMLAGASGQPAVVAGQPDDSEMVRRLVDADASTRMPQLDDPLSAEQIERVRIWIAEGARFDGADASRSIKSQIPPRAHPQPPERYPFPAPVFALAFSPTGDELAVGGHHEVTIWNPRDGKLLRRLTGVPLRVQSLTYDRAGGRLLVGGGSPGEFGELLLVDPSGAQPPRVVATFDDLVLDVAWSRGEQWLAAASADRSVQSFDSATGEARWQSYLHSDWATSVSFSFDDRFVASGSRDCTVKVLEAETGELFTTFNGHQMQYGDEVGRFEVYALRFSPDGPQAWSAGEGQSARVWEPEKARAESGDARDMEERFRKDTHARLAPHNSRRPAFQIASDGRYAYLATGDGPVKQFDAATLEPGLEFSGQSGWVFSVACDATGQRVAAGAYDGQICVWDTATGQPLAQFVAQPGASDEDSP